MKLIYHFPNTCLHLDFFVNPIPALAMIAMALNDHWGKYYYPSWLTGKLSDFLGVFYFPIFISAGICLVTNFIVHPAINFRHSHESLTNKKKLAYITPKKMWVGMSVTALALTAVKVNPQLTTWIESLFSILFFKIQLTSDPTDLFAFLILPMSYQYAKNFFNKGPVG